MDNARAHEIIYWQIPVLLTGWSASLFYFGRNGMPILNDGAAVLVSLRLVPVVLSSLIRPFGRPFQVTPKGSMATRSRVSLTEALMVSALIVLSLGGILINLPSDTRIIDNDAFLTIGGFWTAVNVVTLAIALLMCFESPAWRVQERFPVSTPARLRNPGGDSMQVRMNDVSLTGASLDCVTDACVAMGDIAILELPGVGEFPVKVVRVRNDEIGVDFDPEPIKGQRVKLINFIYTTGIDNAAHVGETLSLLSGLINRLWGERQKS